MTNIMQVNYKEEMEKSYIDYAMSVIVQRALPDVRDGLKPVHRRILYAMKDLNLEPDKAFKKSARIVGDVLGKYHPHSDVAVYDAMVRLAQDYNINHTLVQGQGNLGSIDGDSPAAMRYTEAKLDPLAMELLKDLDKDVVDFVDNFDNSLKEPEVLPSSFFNLLVNGSTGIAVGMSTNIPPHNLNEVNNACKAYFKNENITDRGLLQYIKGPDFPTGGIITNKSEIKEIYEKGSGLIRIRGVIKEESLSDGRNNLVITEIPYTLAGNKTALVEELVKLITEKKLSEIVDIGDESNRDGIRIVLEVKRGIDLENLKLKLYDLTRLEESFSINMLTIVDGRPEVLSIRELISKYIEFLKEINIRKFNFKKISILKDIEIREGLLKAYSEIDLIIKAIRNSKSRKDIINAFVDSNFENMNINKTDREKIKALKLSKTQAEAILTMQLQRLLTLEEDKIKTELKEILEELEWIDKLLNSPEELNNYLAQNLDEIKKEFGRNRRTKIIDSEESVYEEIEEVITVYALIDRFNYFKLVDETSYNRTNESTLENFNWIVQMKSDEDLWIFGDDGNFYQIKSEDMTITNMGDRGIPLENQGKTLLAINNKSAEYNKFLFGTKNGLVKIVDAKEYITNRRKILSTKLRDDDELIFVGFISVNIKELIIKTENSRKLRINIDDIPNQGRNTLGVRGINLNIGDSVKSFKLSEATDYHKRRRGAKGKIVK